MVSADFSFILLANCIISTAVAIVLLLERVTVQSVCVNIPYKIQIVYTNKQAIFSMLLILKI